MPDVKKVIKGLECCDDAVSKCGENCPYWIIENCQSNMQADALALLKAQEPRAMADTELEAIRKAPLILKPNVDAVPVVRCRDCKYYAINRLTKAYEPDKRFNPSVCIIGKFARPRKPDWYCADGERRDDDAVSGR